MNSELYFIITVNINPPEPDLSSQSLTEIYDEVGRHLWISELVKGNKSKTFHSALLILIYKIKTMSLLVF